MSAVPAERAIEGWMTAAWLLAVEARALLEDHEGGAHQPALRRVVAGRLVEALVRVDAHMRGCADPPDEHQLALGLEHGLQAPLAAAPARLLELLAGDDADAAVVRLWDDVLTAFPGELPDPLQASGQGEMLRALRAWSRACAAAGVDAGFLEPLLKDA